MNGDHITIVYPSELSLTSTSKGGESTPNYTDTEGRLRYARRHLSQLNLHIDNCPRGYENVHKCLHTTMYEIRARTREGTLARVVALRLNSGMNLEEYGL